MMLIAARRYDVIDFAADYCFRYADTTPIYYAIADFSFRRLIAASIQAFRCQVESRHTHYAIRRHYHFAYLLSITGRHAAIDCCLRHAMLMLSAATLSPLLMIRHCICCLFITLFAAAAFFDFFRHFSIDFRLPPCRHAACRRFAFSPLLTPFRLCGDEVQVSSAYMRALVLRWPRRCHAPLLRFC